MIQTVRGIPIEGVTLSKYMDNLVNLFFKVLPIRESEESSIVTYMQSLQAELLGCKELIEKLNSDSMFLSLVSILQFLIDNPASEVPIFRREVFKAISICNKLKCKYFCGNGEEVGEDG